VIAKGVDPDHTGPAWHEETPAYKCSLNIYDTLSLPPTKDRQDSSLLVAEAWKPRQPDHLEFRSARGSRSTTGRRSTPRR